MDQLQVYPDEQEPVVLINGAYHLMRREDVLAVLRDPQTFVTPKSTMPSRLRDVVQPLMSPRSLSDIRNALRRNIAAVVGGVAPAGVCEVMAEVCWPVFYQIIATVFGVPADTLAEDLVGLISRRQDGLLSKLCDADGPFADADVVELMGHFVNAGFPGIEALIGFGLLELARDGALRGTLSAQPDQVGAFVDDLLRWQSPVPFIMRTTVDAVTVAGIAIPAGSTLVLRTAAQDGQRDLTFGAGPFSCVANHLTKLALVVFVQEWLRRIPDFQLDTDTVPSMVLGRVAKLSALPLRWSA